MDLTVFRRQLAFWAFHVSLNALPSFIIAVAFANLAGNPAAIPAMVTAIATFIVIYSVLTSLPGPLQNHHHVLTRALSAGTRLRAWISGASLVALPCGGMLATPDFWCGFYAANFVDFAARQFGGSGTLIDSPQLTGFAEIFVITLLEGIFLSFVILLISFFAMILLQSLDRRKAFLSPGPRHLDGV